MMTKIERMSAEAISKLPAAVELLKKSAANSEATARETRARVRRQRMVNQQIFKTAQSEEELLEMPDSWRDDEPTVKTTLPDEKK
jgi:hypothetical protein